jgi:catechol 2,3-dioxygenase-like lactoylglutathione lyase family enzyme
MMKAIVASALFLIVGLSSRMTDSISVAQNSAARPAPVLINTCVITNDVKKLTAFYAQVLQIEPHKSGEDYVEFLTGAGRLALFSADAQEKYIPGSATPGQNHSAILEFRVGNVDEEYARLHDVVKTWVKGPTTQPWGTRSIYFRDPDGNLVDFFAPVASQ